MNSPFLSAIFVQVNSITDQSIGWTGGTNTMSMATFLRFRNVHQATNDAFYSEIHSIGMENLFGKEDARYGMFFTDIYFSYDACPRLKTILIRIVS